jgi:hypothetical protein
MSDTKSRSEKQSGEKQPGTFHYNPGNMSGKEAGSSKEHDKQKVKDDAEQVIRTKVQRLPSKAGKADGGSSFSVLSGTKSATNDSDATAASYRSLVIWNATREAHEAVARPRRMKGAARVF